MHTWFRTISTILGPHKGTITSNSKCNLSFSFSEFYSSTKLSKQRESLKPHRTVIIASVCCFPPCGLNKTLICINMTHNYILMNWSSSQAVTICVRHAGAGEGFILDKLHWLLWFILFFFLNISRSLEFILFFVC